MTSPAPLSERSLKKVEGTFSKRKTESTTEIVNSVLKRHHTDRIALLDTRCINAVRCLAAELPQQANSGHPGAPMGCAPMAHVLFGYLMNYCSKQPDWINRDRFVLSNGHACALQYCMLYLVGYHLPMEQLKLFRRLHSHTPGHPESFDTPGVEVCTGPLGQGISNAVGMAIASAHFAARYNRDDMQPLFNNFIYCICGDGCLQEGISSEACSLAGHLGLGRLIVLYDDNDITIDGSTELSFTEDVSSRFRAYGWDVQEVLDGDDNWEAIREGLEAARNVLDKPSLIKVRTTIAYGSLRQGSEKTHGAPLGADDISQLRKKTEMVPPDGQTQFWVPDDVKTFYQKCSDQGMAKYKEWELLFTEYSKKYPVEAAEINRRKEGKLPDGVEGKLPSFDTSSPAESTRALSGKCLNAFAKNMPEIIGGSADLTGSNSSALENVPDLQKGQMQNRYIRFGVREHAMAAVSNGLFAYGGLRPFAATFLNFITYAWGAIRLSALSRFGVLYIATHDSIELGEDGPTHQPIETIALCRSTPNVLLIRPGDGKETAGAYRVWIRNNTRPTVLALCRSGVPPLAGTSQEGVLKGGYVIEDFGEGGGKKIILGGSGSELHLCVEAKRKLEETGFNVRVVSMPCWDLFEEQDEKYREETLRLMARAKGEVITAYVEAASVFGWDKYFDVHFGMTTFGKSAPKKDVMAFFGFTVDNIVSKLKERAY